MQMYEVVVPPGVRPNQSFSILANGQRVLVTCPPNVRPGMKVRFQLPSGDPASSAGGKGGGGLPFLGDLFIKVVGGCRLKLLESWVQQLHKVLIMMNIVKNDHC